MSIFSQDKEDSSVESFPQKLIYDSNQSPKFILNCLKCGNTNMIINKKPETKLELMAAGSFDEAIFLNYYGSDVISSNVLHSRRLLNLCSNYCKKCEEENHRRMTKEEELLYCKI